MGMKEWRAGLLGCGAMGRVHTACLAELEGMAMVAFCDVVGERAEALCREAGGEYATTEAERVLEDPSLDLVYICTQHDTHAAYCMAAARAGKHMLCEKPLALTVEACQAIGRAVEETGVWLMTGFKLRYYALVQQVRALVPHPLLVTMQMMDNRWPADHWANDPVQGGGNVLSQGVHSCDLLRYLAGGEPRVVYGAGGNYYQPSGVVDNLAAVYRFENGTVGSLVQGDAACPSLVSKFYLQLFGEDRSATLSNRLCTLTYQETGRPAVVYQGQESGFLEENRAFRDALNRGEGMPIDHRDGLMATLMVLQAFRSLETGQPQPVAGLLQAGGKS
jgi:predicted dehydrogenase